MQVRILVRCKLNGDAAASSVTSQKILLIILLHILLEFHIRYTYYTLF